MPCSQATSSLGEEGSCSSSGQERRGPHSLRQRRVLEGSTGSPLQPAQLPPDVGAEEQEMHASSGRTKSPQGPSGRPRGKGNRLQGRERASPGGKGSLGPARASTPTRRHPAFSQPLRHSSGHMAPPTVPLGLVRSVLVPLLTAGRLRTKDPGLHRAQEMEALWSVPASEAGPLDGCASGKGLAMA